MFRNIVTIKILCWAILILSVIAPVYAGDIPLITSATQISSGNYVEYNFCSLSNDPQNIKVYMEARFPDDTGFNGSTCNAYITVNGKPVNAVISRTVGRFLSDNLTSPVTATASAPWFVDGTTNGWRVIYAKADDYPSYPSFYTHNPYIMEIDISDMVNTATSSTIRVTNTNPGCNLEILDLKIVTHIYYGPVSPTLAATASMAPAVSTGESAAGPAAYSYSLLAGGGFTVTVKGKTWSFATDMSYPNASGKYDKLVPLSTPDTSGESGWTVSKTSDTAIHAYGTTFDIGRTLQITPDRIIVTDQIFNRTYDPQAFIVKHRVDLSDMATPLVYLSGNPDPAVASYSSAGNPSIHIAASDHGIGMLWEDDLTRAHANMYFSITEPTRVNPPATYFACLQDNMLLIPARTTVSTTWSIYPVNSGNYYDFVNMVRQEWGANFTVDGGYCWFEPHLLASATAATVNNLFSHNGVKYAFVTGGYWDMDNSDPLYIGFGVAIKDSYWSSFRSTIRDAAAKIRQANSTYGTNTKVGIYHNSQRDTSGYTYDPNNPFAYTSPFANANKRTNSDGSYSTTYFGYNLHPETANMVATTSNAFGSSISDLLDCIMLTPGSSVYLGLDGIYWDEVEGIAANGSLLTYNIYDGNTCIVNSNFEIGQECGVVPLLSKQFNLSCVDKIKSYGGFALGNSTNFTKDALNTHMPRMIESMHNGVMYEPEAHFGTPLGYMIEQGTFEDVVTILNRGCLPVWSFFDYTDYDFFRYQWPMTVMELQSGYILGQERIITTHEGTYGWRAGCNLVQVHRFNTSGTLVSDVDAYPTTVPGSTTAVSSLASGQVVVLERLPITLDPRP